jgi:glycosyltransferase involved in cell wall biosynthesis
LACPTKLYEFIHAGLPIVTSDILESSEFVRENQVGEVFTAGDVAQFVTATKKLVENIDSYRAGITDALKANTEWESQNAVLGQTYANAFARALKRSGQSQSQ